MTRHRTLADGFYLADVEGYRRHTSRLSPFVGPYYHVPRDLMDTYPLVVVKDGVIDAVLPALGAAA